MLNYAKIIGYLLLCYVQVNSILAQSKIKITDSNTNKPIYLAHVKFTNLKTSEKNNFKWQVSDADGMVLNPYNDSTQIDIILIGYKKKTLIISPTQNLILKLEQDNIGLNEIVVSANFVPVELKESVYDVKTISEEKIIAKGATNLREILNTELNFKTNNGHVNETAVNLNGLSGNHVKFMIDGVPVEGRLGGNIDLSQINLNEVEKIEIIDGPTSVAYGTNALGGIINVITKKKITKKLTVNFKTYYETIGQYNFSGAIGFKIRDNNFKISGGRNFFNGYNSPDTTRFKTWKPREQYYGSFMYNRRVKHLKLSYILDAFTENMISRGEPRSPYYITAFDTYYFTKRFTNKVLLGGRISDSKFIDLTISQSYYNRTRNIYFKDLTTLNQTITDGESDQDTTTFNTYLFRGVFTQKKDSAKLNYSIGVELKQDYIIAQRVTNYRQQIADYAIFTSIDYKPIKNLIIKPAVRIAYNTKYKAPIIPSLNFLYNLNNSLQIRASYAKGFRAPDLKELYLEFHYNSTINLWGNTNLLAENSDHFNFSVDYNKKIKNHTIKITPKIYYSKIKNLISLAQTSSVDWLYTNIDFLITQGASLNLNYQFKKINFSAGSNYYGNYNSMFDRSNFKNKFFYTNDINSSLGYKLDSLRLSFNLSYKYTGLVRNYYLNNLQEIKDSYIGGYQIFDFSINKYFFNQKLTITAGIKNLFDTKSVLMIGDVFGISNQSNAPSLNVLWGRTYFVSLNYNF